MLISRRIGIVIFALVLLIGTLYYTSSVTGAQPQSISVLQTQTTTTSIYCVYQYQFLVVKVQVSPGTTEAGASLDVVFKVEYADGSPVTLNPELADFLLLGSGYSRVYPRIPVTPTGTPGEYRTSLTLASDIPMGTYKLYCVHCTLLDGSGNFAPNSDISSDETTITTDSSIFAVGPVTVTTTATTAPPAGFLSISLLVGLVILALIIILIAVLLLRRPKKKT